MESFQTRPILHSIAPRRTLRAPAMRGGSFFYSAERRQILRDLWFSVCAGEACVMTGDSGLGKTLLVRELQSRLPHSVHPVQLPVPKHRCADFMETLAHSLSKARLRRFMEDPGECAAKRWEFRWAILVDDAHHLDVPTLERLFELRKRERAAGGIMSLLLVGRPELHALLRQPAVGAYRSEIMSMSRVLPFSADQTEAFARRWFELKRGAPIAYRESASRIIHYATGGVPKHVEELCARSWEYMQYRNRYVFNAYVAARAAWTVLAE